MVIDSLIEKQAIAMTTLRRRLHQIPELNFEEFRTAEVIRSELDRLRIGHVDGTKGAPTATIALLGDPSKPCVALRADIDALPIVEQTGLPYSSQHEGRMHACGHDGHTSTLVGVASVLKAMEDKLPVCVKLIWQPAEEGGGGGNVLCNAGVLDGRIGPKVRAIFGLHGWPGLQVGSVSTKPGPLLAATDTFKVTIVGKGCHGAFPHLGHDPILTACEAVVNLQQFISRDIDPTEPAVVTVGIFNAGTATNIIPDRVSFEGTARTLTTEMRKRVRECVSRRCAGIAAAGGCRAEIEWTDGYPATINDPEMADYVARIAKEKLGADRFIPAARAVMGGEDFAFYLERIPGCFLLVGVMPYEREEYPSLHSDRFDFTDAAIPVGMRMFVELVMNWRD